MEDMLIEFQSMSRTAAQSPLVRCAYSVCRSLTKILAVLRGNIVFLTRGSAPFLFSMDYISH